MLKVTIKIFSMEVVEKKFSKYIINERQTIKIFNIFAYIIYKYATYTNI